VQASLRFSLGRANDEAQVDRATAAVVRAVERQRQTSQAFSARRG
jgi:cysteine sulfinate desulfinase/cysteine desulfurase-like protein